jgi:hypothetical protein
LPSSSHSNNEEDLPKGWERRWTVLLTSNCALHDTGLVVKLVPADNYSGWSAIPMNRDAWVSGDRSSKAAQLPALLRQAEVVFRDAFITHTSQKSNE